MVAHCKPIRLHTGGVSTCSIVNGNRLAACGAVSTASDSVHGDGVVYSRFKAADGSCGLAPRHSEVLDRAVSSCVKTG